MPALKRQRCVDHWNSRPAWFTQCDPVSKKKSELETSQLPKLKHWENENSESPLYLAQKSRAGSRWWLWFPCLLCKPWQSWVWILSVCIKARCSRTLVSNPWMYTVNIKRPSLKKGRSCPVTSLWIPTSICMQAHRCPDPDKTTSE